MTIESQLAPMRDVTDRFRVMALQVLAKRVYVQESEWIKYLNGDVDTITVRRTPMWPINYMIEIIP